MYIFTNNPNVESFIIAACFDQYLSEDFIAGPFQHFLLFFYARNGTFGDKHLFVKLLISVWDAWMRWMDSQRALLHLQALVNPTLHIQMCI
jgi:hypothetical protein